MGSLKPNFSSAFRILCILTPQNISVTVYILCTHTTMIILNLLTNLKGLLIEFQCRIYSCVPFYFLSTYNQLNDTQP